MPGEEVDAKVPELWRLAETRRGEFDRTAAAYDRYRPGYPDEMFDEICRFGALGAGSHVVEIGSGTGIASVAWMSRGTRLVCIEPAPGMAAIARAKMHGQDGVAFHQTRFEDWDAPKGAFDLVFAADSWHWIDPTAGYPKAHACLRPGGTLALVWHSVVQYGPPGFVERVDQLRRQIAGPADGTSMLAGAGDVSWGRAIEETGLFGEVEVIRHRFSRRLDGQTYVATSNTYGHALAGGLSGQRRRRVEEAVVQLIDSDFGGTVEKIEEAVAWLSRPLR